MAGQLDEEAFNKYLEKIGKAAEIKKKPLSLVSGKYAPDLSQKEIADIKANEFADNVEMRRGKAGAAAGVASESALNSALVNIPEIIMKAGDGQLYRNYEELKRRHQTAQMVGDVGGMFIPTGGEGLALAGKGLKALQAGKLVNAGEKLIKAGKIVKEGGQVGKLGKIGSGFVRGGLAQAEQLAPRVLTGQVDPGTAASELALGAGFGGAMGGISEGVSRVPELLTDISKWGNKTIVKGAKANNRIINGAKEYIGEDPDLFMKKGAEYVLKHKLDREHKLKEFGKMVEQKWKEMGDIFDKSGYKLSNDIDNVINTENIKDAISRDPSNLNLAIDYIDKIDKTDGLSKKRKWLNNMLYNEPNLSVDQQDILRGLKGSLQGKAEDLSGMNMPEMQDDWKYKKLFEKADYRDELNTSAAGLSRGSDSIAKAAIGALVGGGSGGTAGGFARNEDGSYNYAPLISGILGGSAVGVMNKIVAKQIAKLATKLDPEDIIKLLKEKNLDKIAKLASQIDVDKITSNAVNPFSRALSNMNADKYSGKEIVEPPKTDSTINGEPVENLQANATEKPNDLMMQKITKKLFKDYAEHFSDQMSFEDFYAQAERLTNGFEPRKAARILYRDPKQRAKFIKEYDVAEKIKKTDLEETFKKRGFFGSGNKLSKEEQTVQKNDIIDSISGLIAQDGGIASEAGRKAVVNDLNAIMALKTSPEVKKGILIDKLQKYGMDVETLRGLGLV